MADAELARFIDHWTIEFVRIYPHPVERVWKAITDPAEVAIWFIPPTVWEPRPAGRYRFHDDSFSGDILAFEPRRLIRFGYRPDSADGTWPGRDAYFQFELTAMEGGTRLRYVQHAQPGVADPDEPDPDFVSPGRPGSLAGWHDAFDELGELLDGAPVGARLPPTRLTEIARNWPSMGFSDEFTAEQKERIIVGLRARERWFEHVDRYRAHAKATRPSANADGAAHA